MNVNREFHIVFQPNKELGYDRRRFFVSANRLHEYITLHNAKESFKRVLNSGYQNTRVKLRKYGIVDFYSK